MSGNIDRVHFYKNFPRAKLSGKTCTITRKSGFEAIFDQWDNAPHHDFLEWLAYALATAWHETGARMQPVREGFADSDAAAYVAVSKYCNKQGITNYAARQPNGHSYYGRGYVQLTFAENYRKMGKTLGRGTAFYDNPDLVMVPGDGASILLKGMIDGLFRPKAGTLFDYFNPSEQSWYAARDLINGDKAKVPAWSGGVPIGEIVGNYGRAFRSALRV